MSWTMAAESEQLLRVVRSVALTYEEQYYALQMARYPQARAGGEVRWSWSVRLIGAGASNEGAARGLLHLPYSPTSPDTVGCTCVTSSDDDLFDSDS